MSIYGAWKITVDTPMGEQSSILTLSPSGATMTDPKGAAQQVKNFTSTATSAAWALDLTDPMTITVAFSVKLENEGLVGEAKTPMGASALRGIRA